MSDKETITRITNAQGLRMVAVKLDTVGNVEVMNNVKLYQNSYGFVGLRCLVPITVNNLGEGKVGLCTVQKCTCDVTGKYTEKVFGYALLYVGNVRIDGVDYMAFEAPMPQEFTEMVGDLLISFAYFNAPQECNKKTISCDALYSKSVQLTVKKGGSKLSNVVIDDNSGATIEAIQNLTMTIENYNNELNCFQNELDENKETLKNNAHGLEELQTKTSENDELLMQLYNICEANSLCVKIIVEQAYDERITANGQNIIRESFATVKRIDGKTLALQNLITSGDTAQEQVVNAKFKLAYVGGAPTDIDGEFDGTIKVKFCSTGEIVFEPKQITIPNVQDYLIKGTFDFIYNSTLGGYFVAFGDVTSSDLSGVTLSEMAISEYSVNLSLNIALEAGTYTFSCKNNNAYNSNTYDFIQSICMIDGNMELEPTLTKEAQCKTFTVAEESTVIMLSLVFNAGTYFLASALMVAPMLTLGDKVFDFHPYGEVIEVKHSIIKSIKSKGNNLVDISKAVNPDNLIYEGDGVYKYIRNISEAGEDIKYPVYLDEYLPAGEYTFACTYMDTDSTEAKPLRIYVPEAGMTDGIKVVTGANDWDAMAPFGRWMLFMTSGTYVRFKDFRLFRGDDTVVLPYIPYDTSDTLTISEEGIELKEGDYIDFENGKIVKDGIGENFECENTYKVWNKGTEIVDGNEIPVTITTEYFGKVGG